MLHAWELSKKILMKHNTIECFMTMKSPTLIPLLIVKYSSFTTVSSWAQVEVLTQTQQIICCTYASKCCYTCSIKLSRRLQFDTQVSSCHKIVTGLCLHACIILCDCLSTITVNLLTLVTVDYDLCHPATVTIYL